MPNSIDKSRKFTVEDYVGLGVLGATFAFPVVYLAKIGSDIMRELVTKKSHEHRMRMIKIWEGQDYDVD